MSKTKEMEKSPTQTIRELLEKSKPQIAAALPRHMSADRMLRIAMTAIQKTPRLLECHPFTLIGAIIQSSQLGLEPNDGTGKAWLIPFKNRRKNRYEVQLIPGYRGLMQLARNSDEIKRFEARAVHEKDGFSYEFGLKPRMEHKPFQGGDCGKLTHVYAVAEFKDGGLQFDVMIVEEVEKIRKHSKSKDDGPWKTHFEEMAKKSVIRRISKQLPMSTEMHRAVNLDERHEVGLPQDLGTLASPEETGTPEEKAAADVPDPKPAKAKAKNDKASPKKEEPHKAEGIVDRVTTTEIGGKTGHYVYLKGGERYIAWGKEVAQLAKDRKGKKIKITFEATEAGREIQLLEPA